MNLSTERFPDTLNVNPTAVDFDPFSEGEVAFTAPATESQKEIWASVQMGIEANLAYNESQSLRLQGELDTEVFCNSLQYLVDRHEALRTTLSPDGTTLCITENLTLEIPQLDLSEFSLEQQHHKVTHLKKQAVEQPFDLEHGPLFRVEMLKLNSQEHLVILTAHHMICDGWSWGVLITELGEVYQALKQGEIPELEAITSFSEYAFSEADKVNSPDVQATEEFWLTQFADSIPILDFPTDRPRPALRSFDSARTDYPLPPELIRNLKQLGSNSGCSLMTVLLAGFEVFLHRLTGQTNLTVGVPAAGQAASGQYGLIGHCVNLLPIRTQIDPQQTFNDYLQSRRKPILDAYDHQEFTFGRLVQKLSIPRDSSRIPLVSVVFNVDQDFALDQLAFEDLELEFSTNPRVSENFELFINATSVNGKITLECQYNTNLFDLETIRDRLAEFETLLTAITTNSDQVISVLPLLPESEKQLLNQWNSTVKSCPDVCLHQLFEEQVQRSPQAVAVVFDEQTSKVQTFTYQQLNQKADQFAHYLRERGVKPEVLVGICLERSLDMIVAVLGILKAGGAYLPLDPAYPPERLAFMLADSQAAFVVTQESLKSTLPTTNAEVICLDTDWETIQTASPVRSREATVQPNNLAYIIYTSGSTGQPKGVQVEHRNAVNLLDSVRQRPGLSAEDTLLAVTTLSFDISVSEILLPLIVGAKLVVVSQAVASDGVQLLKAIETHNPTFMQPTPATWKMLLTAGWKGNSAMKLISTGEALPKDLATQLFSKGSELWNLYGPTETTIWATGYQVQPEDNVISIGYPVQNTQTYILDSHLQPLPIGVPGELYIGGAGVTRGYLNRPELNTERFIANPFEVDPKSRLYKTGDLARFLPNGQIECLGRIDYQVKVRGFRIELGEIETAMVSYPAIREAVVVAQPDQSSETILVGYFVSDINDSELIATLRNFLKSKLPAYMVPTLFVGLEAMPLTPNGKVDRKALPKPDITQQLTKNYVAPRTELEKNIAEIWMEILNLSQVGIEDNFFEVGGHSLSGTKMLARLSKLVETQFPLRTLFEVPTIAGLSQRVQTLQWATQALQTPTETDMADYEEGEL